MKMKKIITTLSLSVFLMSIVFAQKEKREDKEGKSNITNCQQKPAYKITNAVYDLFDSYQKLVKANKSNCTSTNGTVTSFGVMPVSAIGSSVNGSISYASFATSSSFRTIWSAVEGNYIYYGACPPSKVVSPETPISENHIWDLKLVKVQDYAAATDKSFAALPGVDISSIQSIDCFKLEEANGYCTLTESSNYNNLYSGKGIVFYISLKNGSQIQCYSACNQDNLGNLKWKE
jgi:hypothetical protein